MKNYVFKKHSWKYKGPIPLLLPTTTTYYYTHTPAAPVPDRGSGNEAQNLGMAPGATGGKPYFNNRANRD